MLVLVVHSIDMLYPYIMINTTTANKHASIRTRIDRTGKLRTETTRRDSGMDVAVSTDLKTHATKVFFDVESCTNPSFRGADLVLTGRQARTLYRALSKHFCERAQRGS